MDSDAGKDSAAAGAELLGMLDAAAAFLVEALAPYEMTRHPPARSAAK